jgi:hypothetical protein
MIDAGDFSAVKILNQFLTLARDALLQIVLREYSSLKEAVI